MSRVIATTLSLIHLVSFGAVESLPPLQDGNAPQTFDELWAGYDPRAEPLEIETLQEWEEDGVILRIVRYRIGVFEGQPAMMAAIYGFPKGASGLPGLVQIHGGGQYADYRAPLSNAKRGYATISISWAGRINAPNYKVNPDGVRLFWDKATSDPAYRLTTDWGALDAYHAPCRNPKNAFAHVNPAPWTVDPIDSPRNNPWFLCTLGARRALTFLEQQPEVDPEKLGVYGHSMGGKLTVMTAAADKRVKAAVPSCGGMSNRHTGNALYDATISDDVSLKRISCPIMFLSPANDFHGRIDDLLKATNEIESRDWRVSCSPHHNHQDTAPYQVAGPLWFDKILKQSFSFPKTPDANLRLDSSDGIPQFSVTPDASKEILSIEIYYTQHGILEGEKNEHANTKHRFWHYAQASENNGNWTAPLPLSTKARPLWAYANVTYKLDEPTSGAGYYYALYTAKTYTLSSLMSVATPDQLRSVNATMEPSLVIETFEDDWEKEWFSYKPETWPITTHKLYEAKWHAPSPDALLAFDIQAAETNTLVVRIDEHATTIKLTGGTDWQSIRLSAADFADATGANTLAWKDAKQLRLSDRETLRTTIDGKKQSRSIGEAWQSSAPTFRNLRWIAASPAAE